jgi:hypothetical protein
MKHLTSSTLCAGSTHLLVLGHGASGGGAHGVGLLGSLGSLLNLLGSSIGGSRLGLGGLLLLQQLLNIKNNTSNLIKIQKTNQPQKRSQG